MIMLDHINYIYYNILTAQMCHNTTNTPLVLKFNVYMALL